MNRLLGIIPASPKKNRHPARATANERPSIGMNQPGKVCKVTVVRDTVRWIWEASTQSRTAKTPLLKEWRFVRLEGFRVLTLEPERPIPPKSTCQPVCFAVVLVLRIKRLTRATPMGRASSPLSKEVSPHHSFHIKFQMAKTSIRMRH